MQNNYYNKKLKNYSRENRKKQTPGEAKLWSKLRNKQVYGLKFLRQRSISKYIVDFFQPDLGLIIEIDGSSHDESKYEYDRRREQDLIELGFKILRFNEIEIVYQMHNVLQSIAMFIEVENQLK